MKNLFLMFVLAFMFTACAADGSYQGPDFSKIGLGVEDAKTGELEKGCKHIPERNVQKCVRVKDGKRHFVEIPLPKAPEPEAK